MTCRRITRRPVALAAGGTLALTLVGLVSIASAQQNDPGGKTLRLTLGQFLRYSDNIDLAAGPTDSVFQSDTRLGLVYSDVTRTQSLQFSLRGSYEADSDGDTDISDPYAELTYALEGANSRLTFSATHLRTNLDDAFADVPFFRVDDLTGEVLETVAGTALIEGGVRINNAYTLGVETGLQSNVGFRLDVSGRDRSYTETANPDLFDTKDRRVSALTTFRIDPQITARLTASYRNFTAEDIDRTDRTESSYGAGVAFRVSPNTTLDLSLSQRETEVERVSGTTATDGLAYTANLDRALPNGAIGVSFRSEETLNGRRNTLRTNRSMTLRRDGTLSYGIGVTKTSGFSAEPLFTLAYAQPLRLSRFNIELSQEARTDEEDDDAVILTRLSANYAVPLTETLDFSVSANLNDIAAQGATGEDRRRIDLRSNLAGPINDISSWSAGITYSDTRTASLTGSEQQRRYGVQLAYRRELAQDWDMVAQYRHTTITNTTEADRRSNAISFGLEKSFQYRP